MAERRDLLDRIVAEGTRRRHSWLVGSSAAVLLAVGMVAATLHAAGESDADRHLLATGGGRPASAAPPAVGFAGDPAAPDPEGDPAAGPGSSPVPASTVPAPGTPGPTTTAPTSSTTPPPASLPGIWTALPSAGVPPRFGGVRAWTGRELLVWAGQTETTDFCGAEPGQEECIFGEPAVFDGVAFDPAAGSWRRMAPGPAPAGGAPTQMIPGGAWTGSELVVWGGRGTPVSAAYDPARDTWRTLPPGPMAGAASPAMVALGGEVYVVRSGGPPSTGPAAAALDPSTGAWRVLPDPPANHGVATAGSIGGDVAVVFYDAGGPGVTIAALAPGGSWRVIARLSEVVNYSSAVINGGRVVLAGCRNNETNTDVTIKSVDLSTGAVTDRPGPLAECPRLVAAGTSLLALTPVPTEWQPESIRVHQSAGEGWRELHPAPANRIGEATWTGSEALFWGECDCGGFGGRAVHGGYRLRI